jgi:hypothetical protein
MGNPGTLRRIISRAAMCALATVLSGSAVRADIALPPVPPPPPNISPGPSNPPGPVTPTTPTATSPEPATIVTGLIGTGLMSAIAWGIRRRRGATPTGPQSL